MKFVTVATFENAAEAHILKSKLESEGVESFLFDENTVSINPLYNISVGGIKLKVYEEDVEQVAAIMEVVANTGYTNDQNEVIACPNCGSTNLYAGFPSMKSLKGILSAIVMFMMMTLPIYVKRVYRCKQCDTEFKE
ncbi:Putative signal transducing protein [Pustulibacterium marinum]|uniref:Putative signal transducing protein n=1 Tax=Pustulibacterium marinum TaxID=1224947 RepID=A0A1I7FMD0_9FLAO|nr:DUF2007 domain-containing protein [Pustulibacterium marinum]SFU37389.1 Putative signal transducing protein [Pustulibacterium marinum]